LVSPTFGSSLRQEIYKLKGAFNFVELLIVFTSLCFAQIGQILAVRSERHFLYSTGFFTNLPLLGTALLNFLLQIALIYIPFLQEVFVTQALSFFELVLCMGVGLVVFHVIEFEKMFKKFFYKKVL
jgi:Ca2+-transporting ATPase